MNTQEIVTAANEYADEYRKRRFEATGQSSPDRVGVVCGFQAGVEWALKQSQEESNES